MEWAELEQGAQLLLFFPFLFFPYFILLIFKFKFKLCYESHHGSKCTKFKC